MFVFRITKDMIFSVKYLSSKGGESPECNGLRAELRHWSEFELQLRNLYFLSEKGRYLLSSQQYVKSSSSLLNKGLYALKYVVHSISFHTFFCTSI